jgi:hypothetical protein
MEGMGTAPRSLNYADTLPLAVSTTQNRRSFFPQNGQSFSDTSNHIIRIDVNADALLDVQQSYLEFDFKDTGLSASKVRTIDQGHVWIKRLTIESAGVVLEDINNYNKLVGAILQPAQGSAAYVGEMQISQFANSNAILDGTHEPDLSADPGYANRLASATYKNASANTAQNAKNATGVLAQGGKFTGQYHLVSGLLNMDKYLPLFLMGQGFTIVLELAPGIETGCSIADDENLSYVIENIRYVSHIVEMQRDFYDMLRNMQMQSGGSLMIGSSTYRHFSHSFTPQPSGTENINISARVRSLENLLFVGNETANSTKSSLYSTHVGCNLGFEGGGSYNVFIGSVRYPSNTIAVNPATNKGQAYQELRKCFGALGSINHGGLLNNATYLTNPTGAGVDGRTVAQFGSNPCYAPFGISFKSFRHELEDGIDTSSRALPIRLELKQGGGAGSDSNITLDIYAQATVLFYFNMDGSVTASV